MADQEFERIVQEGMAALKKSRERLKADWDKPRDWEEITPEPLKPAVMHIRREFETAAWQLSEQVECVCYLCLHPELTTSPTYKGRPNLIQADLRETWHLQFEGMTESERFAHWTKQYGELLKKNVAVPLNAFLKIGLAQESQLPLPAVEWAKTLTRGLLFSLRWTVPHLIKKMCDEQENKLDLDISTFDAWCGWVYWRAPRFVFMQPSGNAPYDAATAWQRAEDAEFTEQLLRGLTSKMLDPAWFNVDKLAGEAYVTLASTPAIDLSGLHHQKPMAQSESDVAQRDLELPVRQQQDNTNELPLIHSAPHQGARSASPDPVAVAVQNEANDIRRRIRQFEAKIAAIETQIGALQQSMAQAIVQGKSTFRPADIQKAIRRLHEDKKELEFRRDDWQLNLNSVMSSLKVTQDVSENRAVASATPSSPVSKSRKRRVPRMKAPCFAAAVALLKKDPKLPLVEFCREMDFRAAQYSSGQKYKPPVSWNARTFYDQYRVRSNTVSRFLSEVRKHIAADPS